MATIADAGLTFTTSAHPAPTSAQTRSDVLANPGFGTNFTDHMVTIEWTEGRGWHDAVIGPRQPIALDPAASVLHYAQEIFEGLKAYKQADGAIALFRPEANAARFNLSAQRLAMPELPEALFVEAIERLVALDRDWIPEGEGSSLYLRPFMIATEATIPVPRQAVPARPSAVETTPPASCPRPRRSPAATIRSSSWMLPSISGSRSWAA